METSLRALPSINMQSSRDTRDQCRVSELPRVQFWAKPSHQAKAPLNARVWPEVSTVLARFCHQPVARDNVIFLKFLNHQ